MENSQSYWQLGDELRGQSKAAEDQNIQASASPVLEGIIDSWRKHSRFGETILIPGVPCEALEVFIRFLYSNICNEEEMEKFAIHLLTLDHVYMVPQLKTQCIKALIRPLTIENVVNILQFARLCDAPNLYLKCMKLIADRFKPVEQTEGWKFLQNNDPYLELKILKFIDEAESIMRTLSIFQVWFGLRIKLCSH